MTNEKIHRLYSTGILPDILSFGKTYWSEYGDGYDLVMLACFLIAAVLLHKGVVWGGVFGAFLALHMIYRGGSEVLIGIILLLFYLGPGIYLWKKQKPLKVGSHLANSL